MKYCPHHIQRVMTLGLHHSLRNQDSSKYYNSIVFCIWIHKEKWYCTRQHWVKYNFLSAIKMILCKTKCNVYFIICLLCVFLITKFTKLIPKPSLELSCILYMYICICCVCIQILVEGVYKQKWITSNVINRI